MANGGILNNIYNTLSSDPSIALESKGFEEWKEKFLQDSSVQGNVYNYIIDNKIKINKKTRIQHK